MSTYEDDDLFVSLSQNVPHKLAKPLVIEKSDLGSGGGSLLVRRLGSSNLALLLRKSLGEDCVVLLFLFLLRLETTTFEGSEVTATLEAEGGDETLDFRGLGVGLGIGFLGRLDLATNDILAHIILLAQVEERPNLSRSLRTQSLRQYIIRQSRNIIISLFDDNDREHSDV